MVKNGHFRSLPKLDPPPLPPSSSSTFGAIDAPRAAPLIDDAAFNSVKEALSNLKAPPVSDFAPPPDPRIVQGWDNSRDRDERRDRYEDDRYDDRRRDRYNDDRRDRYDDDRRDHHIRDYDERNRIKHNFISKIAKKDPKLTPTKIIQIFDPLSKRL